VDKPRDLLRLDEFVGSLRRWLTEGSQTAAAPDRER
jgi:hypothetical protein